ncbi:24807_t:CDS:1, partial [Gigaspora margarita]
NELEDAKSKDNILALRLEDITVRKFFFFILDIDYQVIYAYAFTIFGLHCIIYTEDAVKRNLGTINRY